MLLCFRCVDLFSSIGSYFDVNPTTLCKYLNIETNIFEVVYDDNTFGVEMQYFLFYVENLYWSTSNDKPLLQFLRF